jgi:hypothetical protein
MVSKCKPWFRTSCYKMAAHVDFPRGFHCCFRIPWLSDDGIFLFVAHQSHTSIHLLLKSAKKISFYSSSLYQPLKYILGNVITSMLLDQGCSVSFTFRSGCAIESIVICVTYFEKFWRMPCNSINIYAVVLLIINVHVMPEVMCHHRYYADLHQRGAGHGSRAV